ncbi:MAG: helix-turn-helix transcriptional regulator [Coprothermobacterota bacterium]|nr:helix-turn-helix transcriptional regulator [Coprothermobacterota bacterium]
MKSLTKREKTVLDQLLQGKSNKEIAMVLGVSEKTVEKHLTSIYHKLDVSGRAEAIVLSYSEMAKKAEAKGKR